MNTVKPCPNPKCSKSRPVVMWLPEANEHCRVECQTCRTCGPRNDEILDEVDYTTMCDFACVNAGELWNGLPREADDKCLGLDKPKPEPERKCPHCGSKSEVFMDKVGWYWRCLCESGCDARSPKRSSLSRAYEAWWAPFKAQVAEGDDDKLCVWCRQECKVEDQSYVLADPAPWNWECTNQKCGMIGPYARSERAAWRTLVRLNRRYRARSTAAHRSR